MVRDDREAWSLVASIAAGPAEVVEAIRAFGLVAGVLDTGNGRCVVGAEREGDSWVYTIGDLPGPVWRSAVWRFTP